MKNKKVKENSEMSQPSAGQPAFTSGRKNDQIEEMSTVAGSIAPAPAAVGKMQTRTKGGRSSIFSGISTSEKFPNSKAVKEGQLSEEDIILMPGQGRRLKPGLMSKRADHEVEMARSDLYQASKDATQLCDMLESISERQGLDGWVQAKITKAADYLSSVRKYLEGKAVQTNYAQQLEMRVSENYEYDEPESMEPPAMTAQQLNQMYRGLGQNLARHKNNPEAMAAFQELVDTFDQMMDRYDAEGITEAQTDYQKRRQRERDVDAGKPVKPQPKNPQNDYFARRKKEKDLAEGMRGTVSFPDDEGTHTGNNPPVSLGGTFAARPKVKDGSLVKAEGLSGVWRVERIRGEDADITQEIPNTAKSMRIPVNELRVWTNKSVREEYRTHGVAEDSSPLNVPQGFQAVTQPDGSTRISKQGSMPRAEYQKNMADYKAQNWTPEKISQYQTKMATGGFTAAEKAANYQQQQQHFGAYADKPLPDTDIDEGWKSKLAGVAVTAGIDAYARAQAKKKQAKQNASGDQSVEEGLKFHGGFPDVDHMRGAVHRDADLITDTIKTKFKKDWDRAVDSINAKVFDDMAQFRVDSEGNETVVGNSAVWAKWDNETETGWFNAKGRPLKPWPVKEQGVAEGSKKMTPREKFNRGLKRQGFDPEAAANRLEKLIAKQKQERIEHEKKYGHLYSDDKEVSEGEVTKTKTGLKHKATDKYGAGDDPEGFNQKYGHELVALNKSRTKQMDDMYGVKWKNHGAKGVAEASEPQEVDEEKQGLWANIHAKRERIQHGSSERMRKPGSKGAPTAAALKKSAKE